MDNDQYEIPITQINIQPFSDVPVTSIEKLRQELSKIFRNVYIRPAINLPTHAFYSKRNRYRADTLINFLRKSTPSDQVTIGITQKDISTTKGQVIDYGIMGLGYQPGRSCIVSTYRLDKRNLESQFHKVALHELGHTAGLPHCKNKTCFMRDAEGKNYLEEETDFCDACKSYLRSKNWALN